MAERKRTEFRIPTWPVGGPVPARRTPVRPGPMVQTERDSDFVRREWMGSPHRMVTHDQRQEGDAFRQIQGVPPGYEHPQPLDRDVLDPGGPRIVPVSQEVQHGPQQSRDEAFTEQVVRGLAAELHAYHSVVLFNDRRYTGRRHAATNNVDELLNAPQEPPPKGWQADLPFERYEGYEWMR